ncbi:hypothetical protein EWM64_g9815 [Hericium alpestre]|uniref:Uncharacterized protein n=1 Tax=Hericium alpestre TaxID=135208 RepID=A0A4Y9ZJI5_9AGAM|nr:hypothetical protein EWM64_g9815 [Hericium alpestre]
MIPDPECQLAVEGERANENAETPLLMLHDRVILNNIVGASIPAQCVAENIMALLTSAESTSPSLDTGYSTLPTSSSSTPIRPLASCTPSSRSPPSSSRSPAAALKQDNKPSESLGQPAAILAGLLGTIAGTNGLAVVVQQALGKGTSRFAVEMSRAHVRRVSRCAIPGLRAGGPSADAAIWPGAITSQLPMLPRVPERTTFAVLLLAFALQMRGVGGQTTSDEQYARVDVADRCAVPRVPVSVAVLAARGLL